jgi:hypothetical protein
MSAIAARLPQPKPGVFPKQSAATLSFDRLPNV